MPSLTRSKPRRDALDWQNARERLARATIDTSRLDPEQQQRILLDRARALAIRPAELPLPGGLRGEKAELELLHFSLGREQYAIGAGFVHRVIQPADLTRLPGSPPHLRGVTNLRGEILPVFDLREWFEVERAGRSDETRWLVLGHDFAELCLWADAVNELSSVDPRSLHPSERDDRHGHALVQGVTRNAQTVLAGARLLAHPELFVGELPSGRQEVAS